MAIALNVNEIFASLDNMIISQHVFANPVKGTYASLMEKSRVDGSLYGDQKRFYSTDILKTRNWLGDNEASNLLNVNRPADPAVQAIMLDQFRQIDVTVDYYLTKRAWMEEGAFSSFTSVTLGWLRNTKRVYDSLYFNTFIGTNEGTATKAALAISISTIITAVTTADEESLARIKAQRIARAVADLFTNLKDPLRDYNDNGYVRSYDPEELVVVWNAAVVNEIKKVDLPTIFHKEGLVEKFEEEILPTRYFGVKITASNVSSYSDSTPAPGKPIDSDDSTYVPGSGNANGTIRSLVEKDVTVGGVETHVLIGDEIPAGATIKASGNFELGEVYIEDHTIAFKVMHRDSVPLMSAFEVGTNFFNPRALLENHYLTWGFNTLQHLKEYPFITARLA